MEARGVVQVGVAFERRQANLVAFLVDQLHHLLLVGGVLRGHVDARAAGEERLWVGCFANDRLIHRRFADLRLRVIGAHRARRQEQHKNKH